MIDSCPEAITVFVSAPSLEEVERRLRGRGTDDIATIRRRLAGADREMREGDAYRHHVVNDDVDRCVAEIRQIIRHEQGAAQCSKS